jgi:hypothetical protein
MTRKAQDPSPLRGRKIKFGPPAVIPNSLSGKLGQLLFAALLGMHSPTRGEVIEDANIRTWTYPITTWNMETDQWWSAVATLPAEVKTDKILELKVVIYSDESAPEVFNLTRLSNKQAFTSTDVGSARSGGWASVDVQSDHFISIALDRGACIRIGGICSDRQVQSFFAARSGSDGKSTTFTRWAARTFHSTAKTRGVLKILYACSPCASPATRVAYKKLGGWNMQRTSLAIPQTDLGVNPPAIVDMSATIHSDPVATSGKTFVDDLEHLGTRYTLGATDLPNLRGRGGNLWFGAGCVTAAPDGCSTTAPPNEKWYRLYPGPAKGSNSSASSFKASEFFWSNGTSVAQTYSNSAINRGWLRVEYTGNKSTVNTPYAFRSRAVSIGPWSMNVDVGHGMGFAAFGVAANRIARISTTIRSDMGYYNGGITHYLFTNFYRPKGNSGFGKGDAPAGDAGPMGGGFTYVDEDRGEVRFKYGSYEPISMYRASDYSGTAERGYVLIDYLAGSCEQGPSGFKIQGVPGTQVGDCTGSSQPFAIEGAGLGTPTATSNTIDDLTYVYKSSTAANLTVSVRVESFDANAHASALAGVMLRATLNNNSRNAAMVALPGGSGVSFRRRIADNNATVATGTALSVIPCWLRVEKIGNTLKAFRNPATTTTMPTTGWVQLGPTESISFPTTYYYGVQVSNYTSSKLTKVMMRNLTAQ